MTLFYSRHSGIGALLYALWFLFGSAMIGAIVLGFGAIRRGTCAGTRCGWHAAI